LCDGQILAISQNQSLYSLLGTTYGGDGRTSFALPDLRGRSAKHAGTGAGLPPLTLGQRGGSPTYTLNVNEMPAHNHPLHAENKLGIDTAPAGKMLARAGQDTAYVASDPANNQVMANQSIGNTGNGQAFGIQDPYQAVNFIICTSGIFPSRN